MTMVLLNHPSRPASVPGMPDLELLRTLLTAAALVAAAAEYAGLIRRREDGRRWRRTEEAAGLLAMVRVLMAE